MAKEEKGSVAARAWNATKEQNDPEWDAVPNVELKGKLEFAVDRVKATGIAQTNFEVKAKELLAEEAEENKSEGPMAVSAPAPALGGAAPLSLPEEKEAPKAKGTKAKPAVKASPAKAAAKSTDKSGHVPDSKEKAAAVAAEKEAPLRP